MSRPTFGVLKRALVPRAGRALATRAGLAWAALVLGLGGIGVSHAEDLPLSEPAVPVQRRTVERWVVLGGALVEGTLALGGGARLVGVDDSARSLDGVGDRPAVGYYRQFSAEGVLALRPTRVVLPETAGPAAARAQLEAAGVPVSTLPGGHGLVAARARIETLGVLLGRKAEADGLLAALDAGLASARARAEAHRAAGKAPPRALFLFVHGGNRLQLAGDDTAAAEMLALVGAENAVKGRKGYAPLEAESVVAARPEVVITTTRGLAAAGGADGLFKQPGLALTPAARDRRLVVMDDHALLGFGPHLGRTLTALADAIYGGGSK